jgi:hypothetical protein
LVIKYLPSNCWEVPEQVRRTPRSSVDRDTYFGERHAAANRFDDRAHVLYAPYSADMDAVRAIVKAVAPHVGQHRGRHDERHAAVGRTHLRVDIDVRLLAPGASIRTIGQVFRTPELRR